MTVRKSLRHAALAIAVGFTLLGVNPVLAQTNAVGTISGSAEATGSRVVITNTDTGTVRTTTVDSNGRFLVTALPPGTYKVELQKDGQTVGTRSGVNVTAGQGSEVSFGGGSATELDNLTVTAKAGQFDIDVSQTDTRTVFTAAELDKITVGRNIEDVALLAPGAVRGDSRYLTDKGSPTIAFGGAAANENAFYINGYGVTDPQKGLGGSSLPFDGIAQMAMLTGGYGAEFGRSTGGVVNIVTKRGTNQWQAGGIVQFAPDALRAHEHDIRYPANGTTSDNVMWTERSKREVDSVLYGAYVGGPIMKDRAFFYFSAEMENKTIDGPRTINNTTATSGNFGGAGWFDRDYDIPRWLAKVDVNVADGHTLELTGISDVMKQTRYDYGYYYLPTQTRVAADAGLPENTKGDTINSGFDFEEGGELFIGKYTGALMDNLVLTALVGAQKNDHIEIPYQYDPSQVAVRDDRNGGTAGNTVVSVLNDPNAYDETDGYRIDLEYLAGVHSVRVGYDVQNVEVTDGTVTSGPGYLWFYENTGVGAENDPIQGGGGAVGPGGNGDYVSRVVTATGGTFTTEQYAYFIEDKWQVTDNLMLSLGLRNENFENFNSDKVIFLDQTDQWAPRLGATWDVFGDSSTRVFGNAGRYHLAIPLNVAFRQVGGSTNTSEYFAFTSIDSDGIPQGLTPLGNGPYSVNQEYGQARDPALAAALGLDSYYQDELSLGIESKLMPALIGGARVTYRELGSQIDDNCDARPGYNWAVQNGYESGVDSQDILHGDPTQGNGLDDGAEFFGAQTASCRIINTGTSNTLRLAEEDGDYVNANISAASWGLPKLDRTYEGLDLFLEHPLRDKWYGKIDWTISRNEGNAEGQTMSDIGQGDVAVTQNWDHPEIMRGAGGYLPNDRRHQIKAWGFYEFSPEWRGSATIVSASGRPLAPTGLYTGAPVLGVEPTAVGTCDADCFYSNFVDYGGPFYWYQDGVFTPRGSGGRLPWTTVVDVGAQYAPNILKNQLKVQLDVFNVFNTQKEQNVVGYGEIGAPGSPYHSTGKVISWNAPRSVRFTVRYDWGM